MSGHHNTRRSADSVDILKVWTDSCAELRETKTGQSCQTCPHEHACQKAADKRISRMYQGTRKPKALQTTTDVA